MSSCPAPPPDPPATPGAHLIAPAPPPAEVIVENIELLPEFCALPAPPAPIVMGTFATEAVRVEPAKGFAG